MNQPEQPLSPEDLQLSDRFAATVIRLVTPYGGSDEQDLIRPQALDIHPSSTEASASYTLNGAFELYTRWISHVKAIDLRNPSGSHRYAAELREERGDRLPLLTLYTESGPRKLYIASNHPSINQRYTEPFTHQHEHIQHRTRKIFRSVLAQLDTVF